MIEDKRVGEEAKVECGVLFIRHGEAELPFGYYIVYLDILWIIGWEWVFPDVIPLFF